MFLGRFFVGFFVFFVVEDIVLNLIKVKNMSVVVLNMLLKFIGINGC